MPSSTRRLTSTWNTTMTMVKLWPLSSEVFSYNHIFLTREFNPRGHSSSQHVFYPRAHIFSRVLLPLKETSWSRVRPQQPLGSRGIRCLRMRTKKIHSGLWSSPIRMETSTIKLIWKIFIGWSGIFRVRFSHVFKPRGFLFHVFVCPQVAKSEKTTTKFYAIICVRFRPSAPAFTEWFSSFTNRQEKHLFSDRSDTCFLADLPLVFW